MAVLDNYPGLKVEVLVNGLPLQEYFDEDQEATPTTASNYVEATSGKVCCACNLPATVSYIGRRDM